MNVGILGSGDVAKVLAAGFLARGDRVMLGSRAPEKLADWTAGAGAHASAGTFEHAAAFGEWIVLATLGTATVEAIHQAGRHYFDGKIVIDATNPLRFHEGGPSLALTDISNGERVQTAIPQARVVKAFNTVGNGLFVKPKFSGVRGVMFLAGNDAGAKAEVAKLCSDWNWDSSDMGEIDASRYLEAMCIVWVRHALKTGAWNHAFAFVTGR
jgi:predicted dinucleotide-binding enzyme